MGRYRRRHSFNCLRLPGIASTIGTVPTDIWVHDLPDNSDTPPSTVTINEEAILGVIPYYATVETVYYISSVGPPTTTQGQSQVANS